MRRHETPGHLRYLTFSCYRRLKLLDNGKIRQLLVDQLVEVRAAHGFKLLAWVVMPTHVHLLILPRLPDSPVARRVLAR